MARVAGCLILASLFATPALPAVAADDIGNPEGPENALRNGRPVLTLRPRYNRIEEEMKPETTEGGTYRATLGWRTAPWSGWRLMVEGIVTDNIGAKRFNDDPSQIATSPYPLLPDPAHVGWNRVFVEGEAAGVHLRLGRQVLRMDNQRWISDNDFRQIPQLFEGGIASYVPRENTELTAGYFARIRTTSGDREPLRLTILHGAWNPAPGHALAAYGYFHDQAQNGAFTGFADNSYRVAGVRAEGAFGTLHGLEVPYVLEAASQRPYADGDARIRARYWRAGAGVGTRDWTVRFDYEVKGSNEGMYGLQMPLTDFYGFNGWSLHFFNTPRQGLRDRWLTARWAIGPVTLHGEEHRFRSDFGGLDFGRETDLSVGWRVHADASLLLQHARYEPGSGGTGGSVRKTWLTLSYAY